MSLCPSLKVILNDDLNSEERVQVGKQVKAVKGVVSASFNRAVTEMHVSYSGANVPQKIKAIEGVAGIKKRIGY